MRKKGGIGLVFRDSTYSVLLISASEKLNTAFRKLLPVNIYWPVEEAGTVNAARRKLSDQRFDIIVINAPLPDDYGTRLATELCDTSDSGILLLTGSDVYEETCAKAEPHGVMVLSKPVTERMVSQAFHMICATLERMKRMAARQATVEEKIDEIRLVNRAKWHLIETKGMTEPDAHRYLEKLAMDGRMSKKKAAEQILNDICDD